jgi:hypothetical protein
LAKRILHLLAVGNIAIDLEKGNLFTVVAADYLAAGDGDMAAVFGGLPKFGAKGSVTNQTGFEVLEGGGELCLKKLVGNLADGLVGGEAIGVSGTVIPVENPIGIVADQNGILSEIQKFGLLTENIGDIFPVMDLPLATHLSEDAAHGEIEEAAGSLFMSNRIKGSGIENLTDAAVIIVFGEDQDRGVSGDFEQAEGVAFRRDIVKNDQRLGSVGGGLEGVAGGADRNLEI